MKFRIALSGALLLASGFVPVSSFGQAADNPSVTAQSGGGQATGGKDQEGCHRNAVLQLGKRSELEYPRCDSR